MQLILPDFSCNILLDGCKRSTWSLERVEKSLCILNNGKRPKRPTNAARRRVHWMRTPNNRGRIIVPPGCSVKKV
jgi:hypothetical protein